MREVEPEAFRPPPPTPYRPGGEILRVPKRALELALEVCRRSGRLETCCFWYGADAVTALVVPRQQQRWGNYFVPAAEMQEVFRRVAPLGLRNVAQLHSHPGSAVEHSVYDDEMANSRRALSIVLPHYGHWSTRWPCGIGVHEFQNGYWHRMSDTDAALRVVLTDAPEVAFIDCR